MKQRNNKGFTLIELIMVIVIMGILSAVVVPKFFSLEIKTHQKVEQAVIGNIKSGLMMYSANELVNNGSKAFPAHNGFVLSSILDEEPKDWSVTSANDSALIKYNGRVDSLIEYIYVSSGNSYTLTRQASAK